MNNIKDIIDFLKEFFTFLLVLAFAVAIIIVSGWVIYECFQLLLSPEEKEQQRLEAEYEATPHVYARVDGCTVYTWKNNYQHYFTRCDNTTTTEGHHREYCGKACSRDVKEIIETENKK